MNTHVLSELINTAKTSTMTSRHAAAIVSGRRILSMATNYSLPAGELVDIAKSTKYSTDRFGPDLGRDFGQNADQGGTRGCVRHSSFYPISSGKTTTPFDLLYQRYQVFEEGPEERYQSQRRSYMSYVQIGCEGSDSDKEEDSTYGHGPRPSCRGECLGEI